MPARVEEALGEPRVRDGSCLVVNHAGVIRIASGRRWGENIPQGAICRL